MVRFTIPSISAVLLAMSIGAFGSDEAAQARKLRRIGEDSEAANLPKYIKKTAEPAYEPLRLKGSDVKQLRASAAAAEEKKKGKKKKGKKAKKGKKGGKGSGGSDIEGAYAVVMDEGTAQGYAVGLIEYDGEGYMSGSLTFNTPGVQEAFSSAVSGTYELEDDENGFRLQEWTYETTPVGSLTLQSTLSLRSLRNGVATKVDGTQNMPSQFYEGGLVTFTMFRRPASGFGDSDFEGEWNVHGSSTGFNHDETGISGRIKFLPGGTLEAFIIVNDPERIASLPGAGGLNADVPPGPDGNFRTLFPSPALGTYSVNDDGTADVQLNNQLLVNITPTLRAVITEVERGQAVRFDAFALQGGPATDPVNAPFVWTFTRLNF